MKFLCPLVFLVMPLCGQSIWRPDPIWENKLPPFARTKPVVHLRDQWAVDKGKIWLGVGFVFEAKGPRFTGIHPGIAGTQGTWDAEFFYTHVGEYVTASGQNIWFLMGGAKNICTGMVPISDPPKIIRVYSGQGDLVATFTPNHSAQIPSWEPRMGEGDVITYRQTRGDPKEWKTNHSIGAYARLSVDGGNTWTAFDWIFPDQLTFTLPEALQGKPEVLIEIFSGHGMRFEITRYRLTTQVGEVGVRLEN